jgi:ferric-dicitrate binding protein FerR (iron transport regulator)
MALRCREALSVSVPMSSADEDRRNADECSRLAQATCNPDDRAAWQRLAALWLRMTSPGHLDEAVEGELASRATQH